MCFLLWEQGSYTKKEREKYFFVSDWTLPVEPEIDI